ncbi:MAG: hypothetical protein NTV93_13075 [Verrucomicrobia bacterium]|nr:hypothetical protein [Verrucomicrobiota bacterium]
MKKQLKLALGSLAMATITQAIAGPFACEAFDYPPDTDLSTLAPPVEFSQWAAGKTPGYTPGSGSLTYSRGGTLATSGNCLSGGSVWKSTGAAFNFSDLAWDDYRVKIDNRYTKDSPGASSTVVGNDGTTMYVSFLLECRTHEASFGLHTDGLAAVEPFSQLPVGVAVKVTSSGDVTLRVKSYKGGPFDAPQAPGAGGESGTSYAVQDVADLSAEGAGTNFYVLKIEFNGAEDKVSLFINPEVGGAEPGAASASITTEGNLVFTTMGTFLGHTAGYGQLDEVRFGGTWEDVTPAEKPK